MADDFSVRARRAREAQGLTEVVTDPAALNRLGALISTPGDDGARAADRTA